MSEAAVAAVGAEQGAGGELWVRDDVDLAEWYLAQPWSDGLPVMVPTDAKVTAVVQALGGDADVVECRVPPRMGTLTRQVLAINIVLAGARPEYAPVIRAALLAMAEPQVNLNALQASTHMAAPLVIVNGPMRREIGMNAGCNVFGPGNRANATIGRAIRLVLLTVGGGISGELDKGTLGHPGKYTYCIAENEEESPWAPYHVEQGYKPEDSTVFVIPAEAPHSVTNHVANDPQGILDSVVSAMSTIASNTAVAGGACAVVLGVEHARMIASHGWNRSDVRMYLWSNAGNSFGALSFDHRYGKVYNRSLPKWIRRAPESHVPLVARPEDIHLFVAGGAAGRFSAFIPGWGNYATPVLRPIDSAQAAGAVCVDGTCLL
jgi:hypothetical protein